MKYQYEKVGSVYLQYGMGKIDKGKAKRKLQCQIMALKRKQREKHLKSRRKLRKEINFFKKALGVLK